MIDREKAFRDWYPQFDGFFSEGDGRMIFDSAFAAALDLMDEERKEFERSFKAHYSKVIEARDAEIAWLNDRIKQLNSAIGDYQSVIRGKNHILDIVGEEIEQLKAQKWVRVEDRLPNPKEHDWVLVQAEFTEGGYGVPHIAELRSGIWYDLVLENPMEEELAIRVTHWMPLPTPPESEDDNG